MHWIINVLSDQGMIKLNRVHWLNVSLSQSSPTPEKIGYTSNKTSCVLTQGTGVHWMKVSMSRGSSTSWPGFSGDTAQRWHSYHFYLSFYHS